MDVIFGPLVVHKNNLRAVLADTPSTVCTSLAGNNILPFFVPHAFERTPHLGRCPSVSHGFVPNLGLSTKSRLTVYMFYSNCLTLPSGWRRRLNFDEMGLQPMILSSTLDCKRDYSQFHRKAKVLTVSWSTFHRVVIYNAYGYMWRLQRPVRQSS